MKIGTREFDVENRTYVMGILNLTPDSFSDGGRWNRMDAALKHAEQMILDGADIIDAGGESTRPGYVQIPDSEEIERTAPVIEQLKRQFDVPVSVDTYKSSVAKAAVAAGADLINDIWGLKYDKDMAAVIAEAGTACCLMHNRSLPPQNAREDINNRSLPPQNAREDINNRSLPPKNAREDINNRSLPPQDTREEFMDLLLRDLRETAGAAKKAGIPHDQIILDPGIGFGKTYENNLEVLRCLEQLQILGYPVLLGASRKSVIGTALGQPVQERLEGTLVTTVLAVLKQCAFVRVHDVKANVRAIRMAEAVLRRTGM